MEEVHGAATEDGVIVSFAGRDKTSSSELGVELGIRVNLHTSHLRGYMFGPCTERCDVGFCFVFDLVWRCLVHARRDAMSDFAPHLTWYSIGVDGDWKVSKEAVVQLANSMHGEMRGRGFSSSLLGMATARQIS